MENAMNSFLLLLILYPMAAAVLSWLIGRRSKPARNIFATFVGVTEFLLMLYGAVCLQGVQLTVNGILGMGLHLQIDGFRGIYAGIAAFMWMMTMLLSPEYFGHYKNRNRYYLFQLVTLGATVGIFLSANLYTTFVFFEIMSLASYVWVAQEETPGALRAADTYLAVAVLGGMVLLMGLFLLYDAVGTLEIEGLYELCQAYPNKGRLWAAGLCMLFGFGAKAGAFPMHIWLPKAHPVAPAPASALLSGILTKTGVYGILILSCYLFYGDKQWGAMILVLGLITMFLGALLALFSVNLKRTLACSSMSQIGFILTGIAMQCFLGEENALAVYGTFLHMMNHSLFKLVLFMSAGVIYMNIHKLELNDIRGFGRKKPLLNFCFLMGVLGIAGVPGWSGYISKTLIHESIVEYSTSPAFKCAEWIFLFSGGITLAYMLKLYICIFWEQNNDTALQAKFDGMNRYMNPVSTFALVGSAVVLPVLGFTSGTTMMGLAHAAGEFMRLEEIGHTPHFFSWECLKGGFISLGIGLLLYVFVVRKVFLQKVDSLQAGRTAAASTDSLQADQTSAASAETKAQTAYVNLWPEKLDLENMVYRPLLLKILPFIGIFIGRLGDSLVDTIIVTLRRTIFTDCKVHDRTSEPSESTIEVGRILNYDSLSFGILAAGIGMTVIFAFLVIVNM